MNQKTRFDMPEEASVSQNEQQREQIMRKNVRRNTMQFEMYIKAMDTNLYQRKSAGIFTKNFFIKSAKEGTKQIC